MDSLPGWGGFSLCVEAVFDGHSLYSYLPMSYGAHEVPQVRVEVQGPDHVWVNSPPSTNTFAAVTNDWYNAIFFNNEINEER